ncbi:MAG: beta-ketoacyl synthase chain length factor [Desulfovibrio sp.]|nr:beta-ketoacyl synthase chain length factor [Desulfovibrio sp.]
MCDTRVQASVVGLGLVHTLGGCRQLLTRNPLPKSPPPPDCSRLTSLLSAKTLRRIPRYARMATLAAMDAITQAGWQDDLANTALFLGTAYGSVAMNLDFMDSIVDNGARLASPTAFSHAVTNIGAGLVSMLLGIQGSLITISQFSLSFAGALSYACSYLGTGRGERVLVGAVDEIDPRFTALCPNIQSPSYPQSEGAAFFCLVPARADAPRLSVRFDKTCSAPLLFATGLGMEGAVDNAASFGHSPVNQALDTMLALLQEQTAGNAIDCIGWDANSGRYAVVSVERGCRSFSSMA